MPSHVAWRSKTLKNVEWDRSPSIKCNGYGNSNTMPFSGPRSQFNNAIAMCFTHQRRL